MNRSVNPGNTVSVIIPTYNRRAILEKVMTSLVNQTYPKDRFEVVVVDDGSTDGTLEMLDQFNGLLNLVIRSTKRAKGKRYGNPGPPKNLGIAAAKGDILVFMDDDLVAVPDFIQAHVDAHEQPKIIGNGVVIQTSNFDDPFSEKHKWTDYSRNPFAGLNSSIHKHWLVEAGNFDEDFAEYGWEDLEAAVRLKKMGLRPKVVAGAIGYHYKPATYEFRLDDWIAREEARARMAVVFYRKHPTYEVKLMTTIMPSFFALEKLVSIGGWPYWQSTRRLIERLEKQGRRNLVLFLSKFVTLHAYAETLRKELRRVEGQAK